MSIYYAHTLITKQKDFIPSASQTERFLSAMVFQNVVPGNPSITLRTPTGKFREYPHINPFTGEKIRFEIRDRKNLMNLDEITKALESLDDYELEVAGVGRPDLPPIPLEFNEPYHISVTCFVNLAYRSTSDLHDESDCDEKAPPYRESCLGLPKVGFFSNPHNMEVIKVPEAGYARFWVEFGLGKSLFPELKNYSLDILNPQIITEAENVFGVEFVQGCYWG